MKYNLFSENLVYSFDDDMNVIIVTKLNDKVSNTDFIVDDKAFDFYMKNRGEVSIGKQFVCKSGKLKYTGKLLEHLFDKPKLELENKIVNFDLDKLIKASNFTARDNKKLVLTGVKLCDNGNIYATDSFIAYRNYVDDNVNNYIVIPNYFIDILKSVKGDVKISFDGNKIVVETENNYYIGRLIDMKYPNIESVYSSINNVFNLEYNDLKDFLNTAKNLNCDHIEFDNKKVIARGENELEFEKDFSEDFNFTVSFRYLLKVFNCVENLTINFNGNLKPLTVDEKTETYLMLPMKKA